jgi:uncharacterized protein (DUF58 family)
VDTPERRGIALGAAIFLAVVAVAVGRLILVAWAGVVGSMAAAGILWSRAAWRRVEVEAWFHPRRTFINEPARLRVRIQNRKRFPLPLVRLGVWLPPGLLPLEGETDSGMVRGFQRRLSMGGRSEAVVDLPVRALHRGEYWLERIDVDVADPFDLVPLRREFVPDADLLVMPQPRIAVPAEVRRRLPFGNPVRASRMFEDRERFAGVRAYEPGDPLNRIHWRLTGHAGILQTKLFEPTRSAEVLLMLDLSVGEPFWDAVYPDIAEETIGWGSFLARQAIESGWRVGMVANTHLRRGRGALRVPSSAAVGHEAVLFAALARMPNEPTSDLWPVVRETGRRMGGSTTAVIVSPKPGLQLWQEMVVLRRRGAEVVHLSPLEVLPWGVRL